MRPLRVLGILALCAALPAVLAGCSTDATMNDPPGAQAPAEDITPEAAIGPVDLASPGDYREFFTGELAVRDQTTDGTSVRIRRAGMDDMVAWVAVRHADPPRTRQLLGATRLPVAGIKDDASVELDPALPPGEHALRAVLYQDARPVGRFNPQAQDNPVTDGDGDVISERFRATVPPG